MKNHTYRRGDIYLADLSPALGSEQGGIRPVIIIQNNIGNKYSPTIIVAALTTKKLNKQSLPTHYLINDTSALQYPSTVMTEQLRTIDKTRLYKYLGSVSSTDMIGINNALSVSIDLKS